jgi:hypothetical protein
MREFVPLAELTQQPGKVLILNEMFPKEAPLIETIAQEMVKAVRGSGAIKLLSFQCHGFSGGIELYSDTLASAENVTSGNAFGKTARLLVKDNVFKLRQFVDCMDPSGVCELHSCNTAAAGDPTNAAPPGQDNAPAPSPDTSSVGTEFMQALANLLGVPVRAAVKVQGGDTAVGWDGPTVTIQPAAK